MPARSLATPLGPLTVRVEGGAVARIAFAHCPAADDDPLLAEAVAQLEAYFARRLTAFDLPLAPATTAFRARARAAMCAIPYGATASYGALARRLGASARAVGGACRDNPLPIVVPCHRVLAAGGGLGGYSGGAGLATKHALLALEGALL